MNIGDFVVANIGEGRRVHLGQIAPITTHFEEQSVCQVKEIDDDQVVIHVIGDDTYYSCPISNLTIIDLHNYGDQYDKKICNRCHVLKPTLDFARNQTQTGNRIIRRPTCQTCRLDIDRRNIPKRVKNEAEKLRPNTLTVWQCPICEKQTIVGITSKLVLDHDHRSGYTRGFICDSCNTGLGRFRDGIKYLRNAISWLDNSQRPSLVEWTEEERAKYKKPNE